MLKGLAEANGLTVNGRYLDLIDFKNKNDARTGDEIAIDIIKRCGLKVKNNEFVRTRGEDIA